jgi:hypothetical protein
MILISGKSKNLSFAACEPFSTGYALYPKFDGFVKSSAGKAHGDMTQSRPHPSEAYLRTPQ